MGLLPLAPEASASASSATSAVETFRAGTNIISHPHSRPRRFHLRARRTADKSARQEHRTTAPAAPNAPVAPVAPIAPVAPVAPVAPIAPIAPSPHRPYDVLVSRAAILWTLLFLFALRVDGQ